MDPIFLKLLQLGALVQSSIVAYLDSPSQQENDTGQGDSGTLPPRRKFDARRAILAASGSLTEMASDPSSRLLEVSSQYFESRALHLVADQRIADMVAEGGDGGLALEEVARRTGIEARKLGRIMRCLCSIHIFREVEPGDCFANNRISQALVGNEPLRAYIMLFGLDLYSASDSLPKYLTDPAKGASYDVAITPWQDAVGTAKTRWEWLEESVSTEELQGVSSGYPGPFGAVLQDATTQGKAPGEQVPRPEHGIFGLAMLGGGRITGEAHLHDFPWASLGDGATVVDVGGGVGGFCLQLSRLHPRLVFVVQDRAPVLRQAEQDVWPRENPEALSMGRVRFVPHDFFSDNPVREADVYWLRYILHDWADDYCIRILQAIRGSMGKRSRILICDQVMNTTLGAPELPPAPPPLPANWGYYARYSHQRDLAMMSIINGIERRPDEFRALAQQAGLKLRSIWDCRSQVGLVELVLPESEL